MTPEGHNENAASVGGPFEDREMDTGSRGRSDLRPPRGRRDTAIRFSEM
jgi:hypothetical protein